MTFREFVEKVSRLQPSITFSYETIDGCYIAKAAGGDLLYGYSKNTGVFGVLSISDDGIIMGFE